MRHFVSAAERQNLEDLIMFIIVSGTPNIWAETTQPRPKEGFFIYFLYSSPFLGGPWLLVWGKVEGWVYISGFCQLSSFGFHRWMEAIQKSSRTETIVSNSSRWLKVFFSDAAVGSTVNLLLPSACRTWELPNSTSPLPGYVRSSLGSPEPWRRRRERPRWYTEPSEEVGNVTECSDV